MRPNVDPEAQYTYLREGSAIYDGSAAQTSGARKFRHCTHPGHMSFDEHTIKFTSLAVESFGRLEQEGHE